jgi:hypothetical protein
MTKFEYDSIDGGHRKRSLWSWLNDEIELYGKYFSQLSEEEKNRVLDTQLTFDIYNKISTKEKGYIFRTLNKTTDVNFIEMVNAFGDIPIANFIRETVRRIKQIDNPHHDLFTFYFCGKKQEPKYQWLSFDNDRLKQDHAVARIAYRYFMHSDELFGGASDSQIEEMYQDESITDAKVSSISPKVKKHLDFLRTMADCRKERFNKNGLTQHDFKALSYLYFYLLDTHDSFEVGDSEKFFDVYAEANTKLMNQEDKYAKIIHKDSGYTVNVMYKKYIAAPWDTKKIKTATTYLIGEMGELRMGELRMGEMGNIDDLIKTKDPKRNFTVAEKQAKLAAQKFKCDIDGKSLKWEDAHAAHIIAHKNGGRTVYSNLAMVRACYNTEMGSMDLNEYKVNKKLTNAA